MASIERDQSRTSQGVDLPTTSTRRRFRTAAVAVAATIASAMPVLPAAAADRAPTLEWGACPDTGTPTPGLRCATLDVPLDYRNPGGPTIELTVSRLASANPAQRRGVLLMNPGGPGGPGLDMPTVLVSLGTPVSVLDSYDLIGFDPRGVGHSTPVTCDLTPDELQINIPPYARGPADVERRAAEVRGIAGQCARSETAAILPYISTANTARDMDRIRAALGEQKISYYGISYGSYLGAVYSTLFPHRTDRIVLDSVTGPGGLDPTGSRRLARGFQDRFPDFASWAAARHDTYQLGRTPRAVTAKYFELAGRLDQTPVGGVDGAQFRVLTFGSLYADVNFPRLAQNWQAIDRADAAAVQVTALQVDLENVIASQLHVVCNDVDWPESVRTYQRNVELDRVRLPMFGAAAANIWACAFWATDPLEPQVRINDRGPSNILLVQNLRDPATPLVGAIEMRHALGHRARLTTVDQGGHGVFLFDDNACGNNTVTRYLVDGKRPPRDTSCPSDNGGLFDTLSADQHRERQNARDKLRGLERNVTLLS